MLRIDLNADVGEGERDDAALLTVVSSCNIACGGHAGDADSMAACIAAALRRGVAIGAHPAYPDRVGFGRRSRFLAGGALYHALSAQLEEFAAIAGELGARVTHVKPHGALYHDAAGDCELADCVARAANELPGRAALVGPPDSALQAAALELGVPFLAEAFADRRYRDDGALVPRGAPGALIEDAGLAAEQALMLVLDHQVVTASGGRLAVHADTLCVHGDTPGAAALAAAIRETLVAHAVQVAAPAGRRA